MTQRSFFILAAVTLLLVIAAVLVPDYGTSGEPATQSGQVFPELSEKAAAIAHLAVGAGEAGGSANLDKKGDGWTLAEKGDYPADPAKVRAVLDGLAQLRFLESKTDRPDLLSRLDLSVEKGGKGRPIEAKDGSGKAVAKLILGKHRSDPLTTGQNDVYFRVGDATQAWLGQPAFDLPADQAMWLKRDVPAIDPASVKQVVITQPDRSTLTIARGAADQPFSIVGLPAGTTPKPAAALADLAGGAAAFDLQDVMPASAFAFPATGNGTAEFTTFDGSVLRYELTDRSGGTWARLSAHGPAGQGGLNARYQPWVYELPAPRATTLKSKLADVTEPPQKGS